jgi:archaellum component FlaD/FlaE
MEIDERVNRIENEIKVLKNEVQAVLLDIRESYLNRENPFNPEVSAIPIQPAMATITTQQAVPPPAIKDQPLDQPPGGDHEDESSEIEKMDDDIVAARNQQKQPKAEDLGNEEEPAYEALDEGEEITQEEVKRVLQSDIQPVSSSKSRKTDGSSRPSVKVDLVTIAGLTQWVADTVKRLGHEKTETILDISEIVGLLTPELKNILFRFVDRNSEENNGSATIRDYIASLVELERLLGMNIKSDEMALLSIICQEAQP